MSNSNYNREIEGAFASKRGAASHALNDNDKEIREPAEINRCLDRIQNSYKILNKFVGCMWSPNEDQTQFFVFLMYVFYDPAYGGRVHKYLREEYRKFDRVLQERKKEQQNQRSLVKEIGNARRF